MEHVKSTLPLPPLRLKPSRKGERRLYVLGADDPEMEEIILYLTVCGCAFVYATYNGNRVNPQTAYCADPMPCESGTTLVFVECRPREFLAGEYFVTYVDHHNDGDEGFNFPPSSFLLGSSLGQLSMIEKMPLTEYQLIIAALDHCPVQAMRGLCPDVDPERAKIVYQEVTLRRRKVTLLDLYGCLEEVGKRIIVAPLSKVGDEKVVDLTGNPTGSGYTLSYICSIFKAAERGIPVLVSNRNSDTDNEKRILTGLVTPQLVSDFRSDYAPRHQLTSVWGDNNRGAGGILPS